MNFFSLKWPNSQPRNFHHVQLYLRLVSPLHPRPYHRVNVHLGVGLLAVFNRFFLAVFLHSGSSAATLAAAATRGRENVNSLVPGIQGVGPEGQEVPRSQRGGQTRRLPLLEEVDQQGEEQRGDQRRAHAHQHRTPSQRQAEYKERQEEEAKEDVDDSEPAVRRGDVAQAFSHSDGNAGQGDWIPQNDARDVEQEVHKGNLDG